MFVHPICMSWNRVSSVSLSSLWILCASLLKSSFCRCKCSQTCWPLRGQNPWGMESWTCVKVSKMKFPSHCTLLEKRGLTAVRTVQASTLGVAQWQQQRWGRRTTQSVAKWCRNSKSGPGTASAVFSMSALMCSRNQGHLCTFLHRQSAPNLDGQLKNLLWTGLDCAEIHSCLHRDLTPFGLFLATAHSGD